MIDSRTNHRCLLSDIAFGDWNHRGKLSHDLQMLRLIGFIECQPVKGQGVRLALTPAGHRYLAGLWR